MRMRTYIDGHELNPGLRLSHHVTDARFAISIQVICETVSPQTWRAEAKLGRTVLFATAPFPTLEEAGRVAEAEVEARLVKALAG